MTRVGHSWLRDGESFFTRIRVALDYDVTHDQSGFELEEEFEVFVNMDGPLQSRLDGLFGGSRTFWNGQYFDEQFNQLSFSFSPRVGLELGLYARVEDIVDFANTRLGRSFRVGPEILLQWGRHLEVDLEYTHQEFDVDGGRLFNAALTDAEITYQFSNLSFLRFTAQYTDNERNPDLYLRQYSAATRSCLHSCFTSYQVSATVFRSVTRMPSSSERSRLDAHFEQLHQRER